MNERNSRNIDDALSMSGDDVIEIRSRRHRTVEGGKAAARTQGAPSRPAPQSTGSQSAAYLNGAPLRRPDAARAQGASRPQSGRPQSAGEAQVRRQSSIPQSQARNTTQTQGRFESRGQTAQRRTASTPTGAPVRTQSAAQTRSAPVQRASAQSYAPRRSASGGKKRKSGSLTPGKIILRTLLVIVTALVLAVVILFSTVGMIAYGPSETARDKAVMSAMQASATKWVPGLFLSEETVNGIIESSKVVVTDVKKITDIGTGDDDGGGAIAEDRWSKAIDGMVLEFINGKTFKGYVLLIKDPSRISVAIKDKSFASASRVFEIVEQYGAIAAINGGEFPDNGVTTLSNPIGLTYSQGECVWDDGLPRTFIGFTKDNKLFVEEGTNKARADELGIRDAVAFQTGNTLITNDGENVTYYYADYNTGVAQRTAIGQLADGTVMFLVTDGRTAQSLGATKNDIIDTFVKYGAVTAGLLDGGSSALLWYRDWYNKYNVDEGSLDDWQRKGLVNIYKAFTNPRAIPTYFIVK